MTLTEIYALVPAIKCKGLCADECSVIPMTAPEWERLGAPAVPHLVEPDGRVVMAVITEHRHGRLHAVCPLLTAEGRCSVYVDRPLICRLWGVMADLRCPHGCVPERLLSTTEAQFLISQVRDRKVDAG